MFTEGKAEFQEKRKGFTLLILGVFILPAFLTYFSVIRNTANGNRCLMTLGFNRQHGTLHINQLERVSEPQFRGSAYNYDIELIGDGNSFYFSQHGIVDAFSDPIPYDLNKMFTLLEPHVQTTGLVEVTWGKNWFLAGNQLILTKIDGNRNFGNCSAMDVIVFTVFNLVFGGFFATGGLIIWAAWQDGLPNWMRDLMARSNKSG